METRSPRSRLALARLGRLWSLVTSALLLSYLAGCSATHAKRLQGPRSAFYGNNLSVAQAQLNKLHQKPASDASVVELDLALVEMFQGDVQSAERRLRSVRDTWDRLEQASAAESAASYALDDRRRAYAGEDYERVLVRVMLTFCSLLGDGVDAESYSLQTLAKQRELFERRRKDNPEIALSYCIPPIAPYLRGILRESSLRHYRDAQRFYSQTEQLLPQTPFLLEDIQRVQHGVHSQPGNGVVYVVAFVGRGPYKRETTARATQTAMQAAEILLATMGEYTVPPTLAPVKVPEIVSPAKPFEFVGVEVDGQPIATTQPITDVHRLAQDSFEAQLPAIMARTVARRVIKKGAVYAAKDQLDVQSDLGSLAMDAAGVLWEATEAADTRCWGLLPREIQILRLELPAGKHQLRLEPVTDGTVLQPGIAREINVADGQNTYLLSYWPDAVPIGQLLVNP